MRFYGKVEDAMTDRDFIKIHHPDIPDSNASVHPRAFEEVHKAQGWVEGEAETPPDEGKPDDTSPEEITTSTANNDPEED